MGTDAGSSWLERRVARSGPGARAWLTALPDVVAALQQRWGLTAEEELDGGTSAWVARVRCADGAPAVLKVALPDETSEREVAVLLAAGGRGYARVLAAAPEHHAVLLEALGPSLDRSGLAPEQQIEILCAVLQDAWQDSDAEAAPKAEALAALVGRLWDELDRPCSARVVDLALECARRRAGEAGRLVVVHGDPHPGNALRRPDGTYVFVDPDGFVADPAYDLGVVLRDWCPELLAGDAPALAERYCRLSAARTGIDPAAIREWGFLERVSSGLHILELGMTDLGLPFLETAERLAASWR
jgi:streptomycin 6-kinase